MLRFRMMLPVALLCAMAAAAQKTSQNRIEPIPMDQLAAHHITPPKLIHGEFMDYPVEARFQNMDGLCLLTMVVDTQGNPQDVQMIHCTDFSFEGTSLDATRQLKFQPAMTEDGKPVPVKLQFRNQYHVMKHYLNLRILFNWPLASLVPDKRVYLDRFMTKSEVKRAFSMPIRYGFLPQGDGPAVPDADGVYTETRNLTGPRVVKFTDEGYGRLAFGREGNSECDVRLTVDEKGKASDPQVVQCAPPELEKAAIASLLKSRYEPGYVRGKKVAMRGVVHLNYGDVASPAAK